MSSMIDKKVDELSKKLDELKYKHDKFEEMYLAMLAMVTRHEALVDEMASFYVEFKSKVYSQNKSSEAIVDQQAELILKFYRFLQEYIAPLNIANEEGTDNNES